MNDKLIWWGGGGGGGKNPRNFPIFFPFFFIFALLLRTQQIMDFSGRN